MRRAGASALCPRNANADAAVSVTFILLAMVCAGCFLHKYRNRPWMRMPPIKIVTGFYALLSALGDTSGIQWPSAYHSVLAFIKAGPASLSQLAVKRKN